MFIKSQKMRIKNTQRLHIYKKTTKWANFSLEGRY